MTTACFLRQRGWRLGCVHAFAGLSRLQSYPCLDQFDQVAALGASCAATAAAARSRMRHLLALYIRAGGRLVFSTGSDCCSNFSAYWVLEQFQRCWGCSGSLISISGLYQILWVLRSVTDRGRYAAGKQAVIVASLSYARSCCYSPPWSFALRRARLLNARCRRRREAYSHA